MCRPCENAGITDRPETVNLAKPNYAFEKRRRELEQKRKKEEKLQKKLANKLAKAGEGAEEAAPAPEGQTPAA